MNTEIYIKPVKKAFFSVPQAVHVRDICNIAAPETILSALGNVVVFTPDAGSKKKKFLISVTGIISVIKKSYPDYTIINTGEPDTILDFEGRKKDLPLLIAAKVICVSLILFAGSATAIMCFHTDAQMAAVFKNIYLILTGVEKERPLIIDIPYSIGLALGIIVFFNHFAGRKITEDPTPIQVEMSLYEDDISTTLINTLKAEEEFTEGGSGNAMG